MIKHFLKILVIFALMIALGLAGVYLINNYKGGEEPDANGATQVAK
jgi:hypothetical protein